MTDAELSALLDGAEGATLTFGNIGFDTIKIDMYKNDLRTPVAFRAALRRQLGHLGYEPPVYGDEQHEQIVRAMFALADARACTAVASG